MIHATAIVSEEAVIGDNVSIGPYTVIDAGVTISNGCKIGPQVHITGLTTIGENTAIHKGAVVGDTPQDHSYTGFDAYTKIGSHCVIREYVTIHRGSKPEASTVIGDHCMLMAFAHVAHDCQVGDHVVIANQTTVAGHAVIADKVIISGGVWIHQFVQIGTMAMVGGCSKINQDIPPFCLVNHESQIAGLNAIGLKRNGFSGDERKAVRDAMKTILFSDMMRKDALQEVQDKYSGVAPVDTFVNFINSSKRGIQHTTKRS